MSKYIVKNCPSCFVTPSCCAKYHVDNGHAKDCKDIEDCAIKKVIARCKDAQKQCNCSNAEPEVDCLDCSFGGRASMAQSILDEFEIYEVEE